MGLNNDGSARLIFDIETAPLAEAVDYLEPVEAPANYKDPLKIAAYIEEKAAQEVSKCALDPDLCRVVAIGWWSEDQPSPEAVMAYGDDEADLLRAFWRVANGRHLIGFNCLAFDLPVLLRRSLYLGVLTPSVAIDKYRHPDVTDLQQVLSFNGAIRMRGLSFYCKRFGFEIADGLTGAEIPQAVAEGRWAEVETHVMADVKKTAMLATQVGCFRQLVVNAAV
jgi:hypothetical protein